MKNTHRGLHLVRADEATALAQPQQKTGTPPESNSSFVAIMVRYHREIKEELEGLGDELDQERIIALRAKKKAVRRCLALYGVHVGA